jgi:four helix bundle protein
MPFDHEKLKVYRNAIAFSAWLETACAGLDRRAGVLNQLERAATSIPLNIAEGNGKYRSLDRCRFFDIARGSALECAACLDVLNARGLLNSDLSGEGKRQLEEIVSMIVGLIRANSDRVHEDSAATYLGQPVGHGSSAWMEPDQD